MVVFTSIKLRFSLTRITITVGSSLLRLWCATPTICILLSTPDVSLCVLAVRSLASGNVGAFQAASSIGHALTPVTGRRLVYLKHAMLSHRLVPADVNNNVTSNIFLTHLRKYSKYKGNTICNTGT